MTTIKNVTAIVVLMTDGEKPYARRTIQSVLDQSVRVHALIIANDALPWLRELGHEMGERAEFLFVKKMCAAKARNTGVAAAKSEYVAFLDGDDSWRPDKIALQLPVMEGDECDLVGVDHALVDENGRVFAYGMCKNIPMTSGWLARREFMLNHPFDETLPKDEDAEWWVRCHLIMRSVRLPCVLVDYTVRYNSLSSETRSKRRKEIVRGVANRSIARAAMRFLTAVLRSMYVKKEYIPLNSWK